MVGLFRLLPVEYDSSVNIAHSVAIYLFGSMSTIHSTSIRKRLPQTFNWSVTTVVAFIREICYSRHYSLGVSLAKTLKMRLETVWTLETKTLHP